MGEKKYKAFMSYSHKDEKFATYLHQELERYKITQELQKQYKHIPTTLYPIFRDRYELNAGDDLNIEISQALKNSHAFIVICSTSSANSQWVNKEIIEFKRRHGEDNIFPIILNGEPFAKESNKFDDNLECFPESLKYKLDGKGELTTIKAKEIVASSIKSNDDGEELATLKLIAGLLNIPFGDFYRRDIIFKEEELEKLKKQKEKSEALEDRATRVKRAVFNSTFNNFGNTFSPNLNVELIGEFSRIVFDRNWKDSESSPQSRFNFFKDTKTKPTEINIELNNIIIKAYLSDIQIKIKNHEYKEAEKTFIKIYKNNPYHIEILNQYAYFLAYIIKRYSTALNLYHIILSINQNDENCIANIHYLNKIKNRFNLIKLFCFKMDNIVFFQKIKNEKYKIQKKYYKVFIDNISLLLYFLAFGKKGNYSKSLFINSIPKLKGEDILFKIEGLQNNNFSYVYVLIEIRNEQIVKIKWTKQNNILVPMIKTSIFQKILKECTDEYLWTKVHQKWTKDTLQKEINELFRKRLITAIKNSFFLDNNLIRKERWLDVVPDIDMDSVIDLIFSIKRENIRYLKEERDLSEDLNTTRYKELLKIFHNYTL